MPEHIRQEPKVLVSTENLTEQEWLAYRRQGIGGSDVAAILGISPFRTLAPPWLASSQYQALLPES